MGNGVLRLGVGTFAERFCPSSRWRKLPNALWGNTRHFCSCCPQILQIPPQHLSPATRLWRSRFSASACRALAACPLQSNSSPAESRLRQCTPTQQTLLPSGFLAMDSPATTQQRRDELQAKRAKLAELKRQREQRHKEVAVSRQGSADAPEVGHAPSDRRGLADAFLSWPHLHQAELIIVKR